MPCWPRSLRRSQPSSPKSASGISTRTLPVLASGAAKGIRAIGSHSLLFLFLSAMATGLSWLFYFKALQLGDVSKVAPIDKLSVAITIFLSILFLGEPASAKTIIGGLVITLGSLILLL